MSDRPKPPTMTTHRNWNASANHRAVDAYNLIIDERDQFGSDSVLWHVYNAHALLAMLMLCQAEDA